ncbi:Rrf2 family transcriptional regulator [uncultured Mailhella sp.]|uniref:RrF2 family transcriptional regulator n=1 Tax=uncultured Mailhella sp. TaxID=1981031 RepID=UPI0025F08D62|nr:Rrf2 family transcriptional regulator [uncultured Mailhella sp.]
MKFFTKSRYALRVMIELARQPQQDNTPLKLIAKSQNISLKYLEQIIVPLSRAGLVKSERGSQGGYRLAMPPEECTAGDILRAVEGSLAPVDCLEPEAKACGFQKQCASLHFWSGLGECIERYADSVTLRDLASLKGECPLSSGL